VSGQSSYLKPVQGKDNYRLAGKMEVPDRKLDMPRDPLNMDKLYAERLNEKNDRRLQTFKQMQRKPEQELNILDKELKRVENKFTDAKLAPSKYGGLKIGEHQANYASRY